MICPACKSDMIVVEHSKIELDYCTGCRGVWFDSGELELLLESAGLEGLDPLLADLAGAAGAEAASKEPDKTERARQTSDLMWRLGNYKTITCDCGTRLRVPPNFKEPAVRCPHCGRMNPV